VSSASIAARRVGTARSRHAVREWLTFAAFVGPNLALLAIFS
jgi:hypothetical protein